MNIDLPFDIFNVNNEDINMKKNDLIDLNLLCHASYIYHHKPQAFRAK